MTLEARLVRIAVSIAAVCIYASAAWAQASGGMTGTYSGSYRCGQRVMDLKLTLVQSAQGGLSGTFTFSLPGAQNTPYTFSVAGTFNPASQRFTLTPVKWETAAPPNFGMVGLAGMFDSNELTGNVTLNTSCSTFNVERTSATASAAQTTRPPAAAPVPPTAVPAPPPTGGGANASTSGARVIKWHPDKKQPQDVLKSDPMFLNQNDVVFVEAVCAPNGASVNFEIFDKNDKPGPQFDSHEDPTGTARGEIVDIDVVIDGASHVAKGFLVLKGNDLFVNNVGVLFYEPGIAVRTRGERQIQLRSGTPLDNITGALLTADADPEIAEGLRTSAGPLAVLPKASSIEMRVPVAGARTKAAYELSPTAPLFREFANRCYAKFGGTTTARPTATSAPTGSTPPSRTAPANPTRRTR